ncbi:hypothetical protein ACTHQ8_09880 [Lysinibacillus odysseyi]|nr:hypothetical protein [Lysinibacillus odysseyi]
MWQKIMIAFFYTAGVLFHPLLTAVLFSIHEQSIPIADRAENDN